MGHWPRSLRRQSNNGSFQGQRCYPDVESIPGGVDGVVIITRPNASEQVVKDCVAAGIQRVWMHQSLVRSQTSVSQNAVELCREHGIGVIAGACPMMYGPGADFGHRCMRWLLGVTGGLPKPAPADTPAQNRVSAGVA